MRPDSPLPTRVQYGTERKRRGQSSRDALSARRRFGGGGASGGRGRGHAWRQAVSGKRIGRQETEARERARLANLQCSDALAAVRAWAAAVTSARAGPMASAHVGRTPRDRARLERKAFPFLLGPLFHPIPHRMPHGLHFLVNSIAEREIKPHFLSSNL